MGLLMKKLIAEGVHDYFVWARRDAGFANESADMFHSRLFDLIFAIE